MNEHLLQSYRKTSEFHEARKRVRKRGSEVGGLWGGGLAFFLAAWVDNERDEAAPPCVVVTATQEEADELVEDLEVFVPGRVHLFPAWESLFGSDSTPDGEIFQERLSVLEALTGDRRRSGFIVSPIQALIQPVPSAEYLERSRQSLRLGERSSPRDLAELLVRRSYRDVSLVGRPGEFSLRGDVLDIYSYSCSLPLRLEFFGDTLDSLREFDPETQRSVSESGPKAVDLLLPDVAEMFKDCFRGDDILLFDLVGADATVFLREPESIFSRAERVFHNVLGDAGDSTFRRFTDRLESLSPTGVAQLPVGPEGADRTNVGFRSVERFRNPDIEKVFEVLGENLRAGTRVRIYCENDAEAKRLGELLKDHGVAGTEGLEVTIGRLRSGFEVSALSTAVLTSREFFNRHIVRRLRKRSAASGRAIQSFLELERNDFVVHITHGIGRYLGIEALEKDGLEQEFLVLQYRNKVKVYVPVSKIELVQKYIGSGDRPPVLDKVGGSAWERKKESVETALLDLASELLEIQALRRERPGMSCPEDSEWQRQFEASFQHQDTPDQVEITAALKSDLQAPRPMDRLICGDVGYGKTELALRAAFKTIDAGRQVAVLVPTTVLAEQHYRTFRERMAEFPVTVEVLSRFRTPAQQKKIVERAASGGVDVVVGTHRLLSKDVKFRDLGLVIIDEEQRFGVVHKETFKKMRSEVDVITLSATPIPRTLHMALLGIRDISNLTTPPEGRSPIRTEITRFDRRKVREIIIRELNRDGQILFVHNRVVDIDVIKRDVESIVPEARVEYAHGQMRESELAEKMSRFFERDIDLLIATTIIENGIDVPTANTIIINEADRYGLSDLHQLRGRVGRSKHQAFCYLVLPEHRHVNPDAQKRMQALVEFAGLGSGFQIAMRDLEIRGAGNILGKQQSGHIAAVGYDMYCRLLEKCVHRTQGQDYSEPVTVEVDLALKAHIPDDYLAGESAKIEIYRRISQIKDEKTVDDVAEELKDRFGAFPRPVERLLDLQRLRILCSKYGVEYCGAEEDNIVLRGSDAMKSLLERCPRRVAVLDARTVAVPLFEKRRGLSASPRLDDERIFDFALDWMMTGEFPASLTETETETKTKIKAKAKQPAEISTAKP